LAFLEIGDEPLGFYLGRGLMQAECRPLVVAAENEAARRSWTGMLVKFGLAAELPDALGSRLGVLDFKEEIRPGTLIASVKTTADVLSLDLKAVILTRWARRHRPSEKLAVELATLRGVSHPELEE
jgi:hypothetical protein